VGLDAAKNACSRMQNGSMTAVFCTHGLFDWRTGGNG
jgi:hypothetical protein